MNPADFRRQAAIVTAAGVLLLLPGLRTIPLVDRDEPRFARATVEMVERGEWIVPYFNCDFRFDKPPLTYWLMRAGYLLLGVNEAGARLHSVIFTIGTALLLLWFGRRRFSPAAGLLSALIFLTMLQILIHGRSAVADMPMIFFVTLSQILLFQMISGSPSGPLVFSAAYGAMALGFLAKGPVAVALPVLSVGLYRLIRPRGTAVHRVHLAAGLALAAALVAVWALPALLATRGEFFRVGIGHHVVQRGFAAFNARKIIPAYYLLAAFFSLFPWILLLPAILPRLKRNWNDATAWLTAWTLSPYIIFSFYATQLPHYVMPAFPALALLLGDTLADGYGLRSRFLRGWAVVLSGLYLLIAGLAACLLLTSSSGAAARPVAAGITALLIGLLATVWWLPRRPLHAAPAVLVAAVGFLLIGTGLRRAVIATQLDSFFSSRPAGTRFAYYRFTEPSLVFYSGKCWKKVSSARQARAFLSGRGDRVLVALAASCDLDDWLRQRLRRGPRNAVWRSYGNELRALGVEGCTTQLVSGVNLARSRLVRVAVISRSGAAPP